MARAQQRGASAIAIWMIVFVALWLTSTVLLVILYTGQEDLRKRNQDLLAAKNKTISSAQERSIDLVREANERNTVVGLLEEQRSLTAQLATGEETDNAVAVRSKLDEVLESIAGDKIVPSPRAFQDVSFLQGLDLLYREYKELHALLEESDGRKAELEDQVSQLIADASQQRSDFEQGAREFTEELSRTEQDRARYRKERDEAVAKLEREYELRRSQQDADLNQARTKQAGAEEKLAQLRARFDAQQERFGDLQIKPEALATARRPDGRILTAVPGDDVVYIDLGSNDRLTLGMQFTVYSRETGIPADGRGKARVEVVSISESSAECRTVAIVGHEVIFEDDLVANPVYDRSRPLTFLVVGQFDLDYDGRPDVDGVATIEALVTSWGGVLASELSALTDFVVVGGAPPRPKAIGEASTDEAARIEAVRRVYERYENTVKTARSLSVPVLTQNIFMHFLGYAGTPMRR